MAAAAEVVCNRPDFLITADEPKALQPMFIVDEDERPKVPYNQFSKDIPIISLAGITGEERGCVRDEVSKACSEWGIFQVVDHGVPKELVESMTQLSRDFFVLPAEEKLEYAMEYQMRGGFAVSSHLQGESVLNWREMFESYPAHLGGYTRWPVKPDGWREIAKEHSEALMVLAYELLEIISEALGLESDAVTKACMEMNQILVISFYPKCPEPEKALGLKRHTDPNTITLILQDQVGGLQASKDNGQNWITVEPIEGAFVVNLGDHMHYLSNGKFKSADHQVVVNSNSSRLSISTFQNPALEAMVYPLDGVVKEAEGEKCFMEKSITFIDMYRRKIRQYINHSHQKKMAKLADQTAQKSQQE